MVRRRIAQRVTAEINVTPLVDVVLVLLVIFLIISPMLFQYAQVSLPTAQTAFAASGLEGHVTLTVQSDHSLWFEDRQVDISLLPDLLREATGGQADIPVLIRGDANLRYAEVKRVMDVCHSVGMGDIRLATGEVPRVEGGP